MLAPPTLRPILTTGRTARSLCRSWSTQQRNIFSLPSFPSFPGLPGGGSATQTYSEERILPYTPREMYAVVADVASYPQFVPFCTGARTPPRALENAMAGRTRLKAELSVGFMAFQESYVSDVESVPYREVKAMEVVKSKQGVVLTIPSSMQAVASSSTPLFKTLSTIWQFSSTASHSAGSSTPPSTPSLPSSSLPELHDAAAPTRVTFSLSYEFANPLHAGVSAAFFGKVSGLMIEAFEKRCQDIYGKR